MPETPPEAFERGKVAGKIDNRLDSHDEHFSKINGSIDKMVEALGELRLAIQGLTDQGKADAKTRITTAAALKDAEEARRTASEHSWTPLMRLGVVVTILAALAGIYIAFK